MIHTDTFRFLADVARHPSTDWLDAHRDEFARAKSNLTAFVVSLLESASAIDSRIEAANPSPAKCLSRIGSANLSKGQFSIIVRVSPDAKAVATYFVHVQPDGCYSGGGARSPSTRFSQLLRQQMMTDTGRWREIVEGPVFRRFFPHGLSDGAPTVPSMGFEKNHDAIDSLNLRGFGACRYHCDQLMQSTDAISEIVRSFAAARALVDFINRATTR